MQLLHGGSQNCPVMNVSVIGTNTLSDYQNLIIDYPLFFFFWMNNRLSDSGASVSQIDYTRKDAELDSIKI